MRFAATQRTASGPIESAHESSARASDKRPRFAQGTSPPVTDPSRPRDGMWRESPVTKHARRLISIPALFLLTGLAIALLVPALCYTVPADLIRKRRLVLTRFVLVMAAVLVWHVVGLFAVFAWWIAGLRWLGYTPRNWRRWNMWLEGWWGDRVIALAEGIYGMRMEIAGGEVLAPGPILIFARHTSVIDTMLPLRIVERHAGLIARIVKKRVLLWDPCVDVTSRRLPRTFVRRGSDNPEREVELVCALADGMGEHDALWIYPEGTRFTRDKQRRVIERLGERHPEAARRAERLQCTLPPRPGGTLALLEHCPGMDVVFCAHTGMEGAGRLEHLIHGSLLDQVVKVQFWRVPAADVPAEREARLAWLHEWWERIDRWVIANQSAESRRAAEQSPARSAKTRPHDAVGATH